VLEVTLWEFHKHRNNPYKCRSYSYSTQGDHSRGKPGKVREFQSGQEKVRGS